MYSQQEHKEELTFADSSFGGGGAPDVVLKITAIGTWGALNINLAKDDRQGRQYAQWYNDKEAPVFGGENNATNDQLGLMDKYFIDRQM